MNHEIKGFIKSKEMNTTELGKTSLDRAENLGGRPLAWHTHGLWFGAGAVTEQTSKHLRTVG